jgi:hypothetical protein
VFAAVAILLLPLLFNALALYREAGAHVVTALPSARELVNSLQYRLLIQCGLGAWLLHFILRLPRGASNISAASLALILGWWAIHPLCLFAFSWITGESVFVTRYLSLALPGAALLATALASRYIAAENWKPLTTVVAVTVLLLMGHWRERWPLHHNSDWRAAAEEINRQAGLDTPVICPSPFVEAKQPVWHPDYPLPAFLYAHLAIYPLRAVTYLFPFEVSTSAEDFAAGLSRQTLTSSARFLIYGGAGNVRYWRAWFANRPEMEGWKQKRLGPFADVDVVLFENQHFRPGFHEAVVRPMLPVSPQAKRPSIQ